MTRTFVVEVEAIPLVAHIHQASLAVKPGSMEVVGAGRPAGRQILIPLTPAVAIGGLQRLPAEAIK